MTVGRLLRVLQTYPQDMRVVVDGYEDLSQNQTSSVKIVLNTANHQREGKHGETGTVLARDAPDTVVVEALVQRRVSDRGERHR